MEPSSMPGKVLVAVIDLDDDLGEHGIETPIIGWDNVLKAALAYAIKRPEDSDLNALFAGLQVYQQLKREGQDVEVAVVSGSSRNEIEANFTVRKKLEEVVSKLGSVEGVVIVSDGVEDEQVVPVLQSMVPILGVRRVIVEQLRGVEETYILIGRYIKKALVEPRFSRLFLGVPGLILLSMAVLSLIGLIEYAKFVVLLLVGSAMVVRGFNLEERLEGFWHTSPVMFISYVLFLLLTAAALGVTYYTLNRGPVTVPEVGSLLGYVAPLTGFAFFSILIGRTVTKLLDREFRIWFEMLGMVLIIIVVTALARLSSALRSLSPNPTPSDIVNAFVESGAFSIMLGGIAVVGLLTLVARVVERRMFEEEEGLAQQVQD